MTNRFTPSPETRAGHRCAVGPERIRHMVAIGTVFSASAFAISSVVYYLPTNINPNALAVIGGAAISAVAVVRKAI